MWSMPPVYRIGRSDNLVADDSPAPSGPGRARPRDRAAGTSVPKPARRSGSTSPSGSTGIRERTSRPTQDLDRFGFFQDEWLRGGPVRRWVPKAYADRPIYTFETGGSTGVPKSRINIDDFRIDYEMFSDTLPDEYFPEGQRLADGRAVGAAPAAARGRAPRAAPRRHFASASISTRAGSSSCSRRGRWIRSRPTSATSSIRR